MDLEKSEVLLENGPIEIESDDPLASIDFAIPVPPLPIPHEGVYALELHSCDEIIGILRITANRHPEETDDEEQDEEEGDDHE